ncbi:MAG: nuclear transport factor 2 family protein [Halioglobus sp.]
MNTDAATIDALIGRITELEARAAIRDLVSDYCHGFDKRHYQRFLSIWSTDCVWDIGPPFGCFKGHAGIHEAVHQVLWPAWQETHHLTTNLRIEFQDPNNATSLCDVDCMGTLSGETECTTVGASYSDTLRREDSGWKIFERNVQIHFMNAIPGTVLAAPEAKPG